ncbi:MAG: glycosyltransferase family 2 protein [Actinobacteria bacterium]|nr:glycosyltransferase family 2 protein [Actinomycetota bacterium]MBL7123620.1 glycosyltransferase family 2 protein [Actinomycetota bacterium]
MIKKLLVAIPAYNEEEEIGEVIQNIPGKLSGVSEVHILVIDDGSTDNTAKIARDSGAEVINNYFNMGYGVAFGKGLQYALDNNFDLMVSIDGDGQFDPEDIPKLIKPIMENNADLVTASRFINKSYYPQMPLSKFWGNKLMSIFISKLVGKKFYDVSCGFRAYSQKTLLSLNLHGKFTFSQETIIDLSFKRLKIVEIPIKVKYFPSRISKISSNLFIYGINALKIILETYRDYKPFTFFSYIALFFFIISIFFGSILLYTYISRGSFSPNIWSGFVGGTFLFISIIFFTVGFLADVIKRIRINQEKILYLLKRNAQKK